MHYANTWHYMFSTIASVRKKNIRATKEMIPLKQYTYIKILLNQVQWLLCYYLILSKAVATTQGSIKITATYKP
jgi:hypothetical protein